MVTPALCSPLRHILDYYVQTMSPTKRSYKTEIYAYAGGWPRYVADTARFGLHRSDFSWQASGNELNNTDKAFAYTLIAIGVDKEFIAHGLKPSIHEIYTPTPQEVLAAQLVTAKWP